MLGGGVSGCVYRCFGGGCWEGLCACLLGVSLSVGWGDLCVGGLSEGVFLGWGVSLLVGVGCVSVGWGVGGLCACMCGGGRCFTCGGDCVCPGVSTCLWLCVCQWSVCVWALLIQAPARLLKIDPAQV